MKNFISLLEHLILRRPCFNCGVLPQRPWHLLCPRCASEIKPLGPAGRCPRCQNRLSPSGRCNDCEERQIFWSSCTAFFDYRDFICKELFLKYKFEGSLAAERDLRQILAPHLEKFRGKRLLLLSCGAQTRRRLGFHPLETLLQPFGIFYETPFVSAEKTSQKELSAEERRNRRGFLRLKDGFQPQKSLLLMDDVMTTGSTFNEACRLLGERGAEDVAITALFRD